MKLVVTFLVRDDQNNQQANRHANSQTNNIDKAEGFIFQQLPVRGFKIAFKHKESVELFNR